MKSVIACLVTAFFVSVPAEAQHFDTTPQHTRRVFVYQEGETVSDPGSGLVSGWVYGDKATGDLTLGTNLLLGDKVRILSPLDVNGVTLFRKGNKLMASVPGSKPVVVVRIK